MGGVDIITIVSIDDCRVGGILAEDITNSNGVILVAKNTVLNLYIISRLHKLGIQHIKIYHKSENYNKHKDISKHIKEGYEKSILGIKVIINDLVAGKLLNTNKIIEISDMIYSGIHDSYEVLKILHGKRELDEYTYSHSLNVAFYAMLMGKWLGLEKESIKILVKSGLLHDIGKTKIPSNILNKKSQLSYEEFEIIKKHARYGYEIVKATGKFSENICTTILQHHERMDKSGYPFGISGEQIGFYAKIISVADVYDAMTSDRIYKNRNTPFEVFEMFKTSGVKNFDPKIINLFLTNLAAFYTGSRVFLNTGEFGEIAYVPPQNITEPIVLSGGGYIDLAKDKNRKITCMI